MSGAEVVVFGRLPAPTDAGDPVIELRLPMAAGRLKREESVMGG